MCKFNAITLLIINVLLLKKLVHDAMESFPIKLYKLKCDLCAKGPVNNDVCYLINVCLANKPSQAKYTIRFHTNGYCQPCEKAQHARHY